MMRLLVIFFIFSVSINCANAANSSILNPLLEQVDKLNLSEHKNWHALLHYRRNGLTGVKSEIISPSFFLAENGSNNPEAELKATIRAFNTPPIDSQATDIHPQCKFIARYKWLKQQLDWPTELKELPCPKFKQWIDVGKIDSISLIFATGYFKNPASFFGHPLIKFNSGSDKQSDLLDTTLNYGAIVPPNENPLIYAAKGLLGGYKAAFSDTRFYQLNHDYSESDLRDLWEYKLNLSEDQIKKIIYHSWELMGQRFVYRFFNRNCAYYIADIITLGVDQNILDSSLGYSVPASIFFNINEMSNNGEPLVETIIRTPSRQSRLYSKFEHLNKHEKHIVHDFIQSNQKFELIYKQQNSGSKVRIIDTLLDYYEFKILQNKKQQNELSKLKRKLLLERLKLPLDKQQNNAMKYIKAYPPHDGSRASLLGFGGVNNSKHGTGISFRLRPASYDFIGIDKGHIPHSTLNMFNFELYKFSDKLYVNKLDLVNIRTLNLSQTGLPGDGGYSWQVRFGKERVSNTCLDCLRTHATGYIGKAWAVHDNWVSYLDTGLTLHSSYHDKMLRGNLRLGIVGQLTKLWKSNLSIGYRQYLDESDENYVHYHWENRLGNNPQRNFRFEVEKNQSTEVKLSAVFHW